MSEETTTRPVGDRFRTVGLAVVGVVALVALAAAIWFGVGWGRALFVERPTADARDAALSGAMQAAINLNSVDADDVDRSLDNMRSSITGDALVNDLNATEQQIRDQVAATGTGMAADVLFGSLTELNTDDDTARALVVLSVTTTTPTNFVKNKVSVEVAVRKDGDIWKAETIQPLGSVELESGANPGAAPAPAEPAAPPAGTPLPETPLPAEPTAPAGPAPGQ